MVRLSNGISTNRGKKFRRQRVQSIKSPRYPYSKTRNYLLKKKEYNN